MDNSLSLVAIAADYMCHPFIDATSQPQWDVYIKATHLSLSLSPFPFLPHIRTGP